MNKQHPLRAIKRTALANSGRSLGLERLVAHIYLACATVFVLAACQPSVESVEGGVQRQLQQKVNATFMSSISDIKVAGVDAVQESGHKYQGMVEVVAFGNPVELKISILADRKHVL